MEAIAVVAHVWYDGWGSFMVMRQCVDVQMRFSHAWCIVREVNGVEVSPQPGVFNWGGGGLFCLWFSEGFCGGHSHEVSCHNVNTNVLITAWISLLFKSLYVQRISLWDFKFSSSCVWIVPQKCTFCICNISVFFPPQLFGVMITCQTDIPKNEVKEQMKKYSWRCLTIKFWFYGQ